MPALQRNRLAPCWFLPRTSSLWTAGHQSHWHATAAAGLEVSGTAAALEQLQREALALGARCTRSQAAAAMFRHLGIEG